jgi:hypothetical protein
VQRRHPAAQFLPRSLIPAFTGFLRRVVGPAIAHLSRAGGRPSGTVGHPSRGQDDATAAANCGGVKVMARTRKTWMLLAAIVVVVGGSAFALWPRGPRLVALSVPVTAYGEHLKVRMLAPAGWGESVTVSSKGAVFISASPRTHWVTKWIQVLTRATPEKHAYIVIQRNRWPDGVIDRFVWHGKYLGMYHATASLPRCRYQLSYMRTNRAEFDATYRQICESFQVIRLP